MSHTRSIQTNDTDATLIATVYNTDGSVKSDLAHNTTGISIYIQRIGFANGTPLTLSAKAAPESSHADGHFLNLGGGNVSVDIPDAPLSGFIGQIRIYGTFTGGTIVGDWYDVVGYDATAVAVGANTTTPPTASANADAVWAKDISAAASGTAGGYLKDVWGRITAAVYTLFTNLIAMITGTGASAKWTAKVLEESPTGSVYILPTKGSQGDGRTTTSTVYVASNQSYLVVRTVTDSARALVSLTGRTLRFICEGQSGLDKTVIEDADITVSGTSDATYSCKIPKTTLSKARSLSCVLRDVTDPDDNNRLDSFTLVVEYAADAG